MTVAFPQSGFAAQTDPLIGTWKVDLAKSTYSPGPAPRSSTLTIVAAGQGLTATNDGINAAGMPTKGVFTVVYDGQPHPVTGVAGFDSNTNKRVDAYTQDYTRIKAGKVVQTGRMVLSIDGKTATFVTTGVNANGQPTSNVAVYEKQ